jgi:hypothetical protein
MALVSPGVEITVTDESAYGAPGSGTIPLLVLATRENKSDPTNSESDGIAKYTKSANAGSIVRVTSQRELTQYFGNPTFRQSSGAIVQGDETNEYGLLAAYSFLGQGSTAYVVRADVDLADIEPTTTEPTADYSTANTLWIDTDGSSYGIHVYNSTTGVWDSKTPIVEVSAVAAAAPTGTSTVGSYKVLINTTDDNIKYFKDDGAGGWTTAGATLDEHYDAPAAPSNGDIWIKTTQPSNGVNLVVNRYTSAWLPVTVQGVGTGAIGGYVPQDGTSATALTTTTAVEGNILLDTGVADTITLKVVDSAGAPAAITDTVIAQAALPTATAATGAVWFDNTLTSLDVYVVNGGSYDPVTPTYGTTAPVGPSGGDVWVDTSNSAVNQSAERVYPVIKVYNAALGAWVTHDNTDQTTARGVLFSDLDDTAGGGAPITGRPDPNVYPDGMIAVNMAQSKNTLRVWNGTAWRNGVANHADGSGRFGRFAQRQYVVNKMQSATTSVDLRETQFNFTLLAAPNYPELTAELVQLNSDRGETGFVIIDTPMRKNPTDAITWVTNANVASEDGEDGLVTNDTYSAVYYPAGSSTDPATGKTVIVPPSHMALYTYAYSDNISFQWFAPAGLTRGVVQNASAVGHITNEGEFKAVALTQGQRDAMYENKLNPITTFVGQGTILFGQKTLHNQTTALDRVNVARLVAYLKERFDEVARPFLFEINDAQTRARAQLAFERFLADILSRRGLNDFAVVCDESNNTPARIDRNELYIDVAIEPSKAAEFIYIPIRIVNTGTLGSVA